MKFRKPVDEASILRFEPRGQDHFLKDPPAKRSIDFAFLKDAAEEYLQGLARINRALNDPAIEAAFTGLKSSYSKVFGTPLLDATLTEAYQDRVQQVADAVSAMFDNKHPTKEELVQSIETQAKWMGVTEYALSKNNPKSTAWRDFQKDVITALKGKISFGRPGAKASAEERKRKQEILLNKIAGIIEDSIGYSFPDGDPVDYIMPRVERLGINWYDIQTYMDMAVTKVLGAKSFNEYMGEVYDSILADNPEVALQSGMLHNPYTNKPLDISGIIPQVMEYNPRIVVDALTDSNLAKDPKVIAALSNYKEQTIKTLLKLIKERPTSAYPATIARNLKASGLDWPELDKILQSVGNNKLWEQMKPGDVLTLESETQSIVGTIISNNRGSVIIEGSIQSVPLSPARLEEAKYQGREVHLGKPMAGDVKKYKVYVKDPKTGNIKKVNFGDKNMEIKRDDPERRKNFRARHGCGTSRASDKTKAAYWSCRMWSSKPVSKILKGK